jgi:hypothetical protein
VLRHQRIPYSLNGGLSSRHLVDCPGFWTEVINASKVDALNAPQVPETEPAFWRDTGTH